MERANEGDAGRVKENDVCVTCVGVRELSANVCVRVAACSWQYLFSRVRTSHNTVMWFTCPARAVTQSLLKTHRSKAE